MLGNGNTFAVPPELISVVAAAVLADTQAPIVLIDNAATGLATSTNIVVSGQVSDDSSRVASLEAQVDDGSFIDISFDASGHFTFAPGLPLDGSADGDHTIRFQATDEAGNVSSPISVFFILDAVTAATPQPANTTRASEPLADIADDPATAFVIDLSATGSVIRTWNGNVYTAIDAVGDVDWFQFVAPASGTLHASASLGDPSLGPMRLELFESRGPADAASTRLEDAGPDSVTTTAVAGRQYRVKVEAGPGGAGPGELTYRLDFDLAEFDDYLTLTGIDIVHADTDYRGRGYSVAIIDTGINYNHPDLAGRVIQGPDFGNHDNDPMDTVGHGTHVAGIVASSNAHAPGVVPEANLIALKITSDGSLTTSVSTIVASLQWVLDHRQLYNIVAVNLSFGAGNVAKGSEHEQLDPLYRALAEAGVFISVAAGNSYSAGSSTEGLNFLAASNSVVAVGAVWDSDAGPASWGTGARDFDTAADRIASFSQRSAGLDLLAPGTDILNLNRLGGLTIKSGTSMAAPFVAGTAVLLREAADASGTLLTASDILDLMQETAAVLYDGDDEVDNVANTNRSYRRIDALAALGSLIASDRASDLGPLPLPASVTELAPELIDSESATDHRATEAIDVLLESASLAAVAEHPQFL